MSGSSTFVKLKYSDTFEEVKTVTLHGTLSHGDSGSWVIEQSSGKLCGHIIAGDISTGLAYVIPARVVFEQIERRYDCRLELPDSGYLLPEDMTERISQLQVSVPTMEGGLEETERYAQSRLVRPTSYRDPTTHQSQNFYGPPEIIPAAASLGSSMTSATSFYPQSSSQPSAGYLPSQVYSPRGSYSQSSAGIADYHQAQAYPLQSNYMEPSVNYQQSQVYPPQSSYGQPSAGYQKQTQGYTSSNYYVGGAAPITDPGIPAAYVSVDQTPIVEANAEYGYPQERRTMYPSPVHSGVASPTAESAGSQYSTQPIDPYYDRAGPYDDRITQDSSSYAQVPAPAYDPLASSSLSQRRGERDRDRDRDRTRRR
ncbi:hypothetical protein NA56DRAFT_422932 [Hyaloscypha hepaticicola]|uniref:Uncharacterized protein n=1 Tax=Hyaloscypha hepaticicola TaxID=2082293 RepID=A0A2J6PHG4_9HELO|nr:hypothetical protein NA56DRAFT_422932 [Hyaloscypha hepaticicola]